MVTEWKQNLLATMKRETGDYTNTFTEDWIQHCLSQNTEKKICSSLNVAEVKSLSDLVIYKRVSKLLCNNI